MIAWIDDQIDQYKDTLTLLRTHWDIIAINNVKDSILAIDRGLPDIRLVLLDMMMPTGDVPSEIIEDGKRAGLYLAKQIRNRNLKVEIIFFSVFGNNDLRSAASEYGFAEYLVKPMMPDELARRIAQHVPPTKASLEDSHEGLMD